jgi:hypothetical protein
MAYRQLADAARCASARPTARLALRRACRANRSRRSGSAASSGLLLSPPLGGETASARDSHDEALVSEHLDRLPDRADCQPGFLDQEGD